MENKKKFRVATLGCRTNQYESQAYATQLLKLGYTEASGSEEADLCIVNTCTVTEGADRSSRNQISRLRRENEGAKIVITGCLADRLPKEMANLEGVNQVIPNKKKESLLNIVLEEENLPQFQIDQFGGNTRAFVKVQDGCNSFCTYCIIPYVRGRSRSRPLKEIENEVRGLIAKGFKEVVITGVNVGDYDGGDGSVSLTDLVLHLDKIEGLRRLRISSIDPDEVDEALLSAVIEGKTTCHSMHIVLQSGSNAILKRMNRKYNSQIFLDAVKRCKRADPYFTFTTDVIVGFPGETREDFDATVDLIEEIGFAKVHMFPYSRRDRTRAALYPNQVDPLIIQERKQKLLREAEKRSYRLRQEYVGKVFNVLVEGDNKGHTEHFLEVKIEGDKIPSNQIVSVRLSRNTEEGLFGCAL